MHGSVHLDLDLQVEQVLREVDGAPNCPATKGEDAAAGLDAPVEESEGDIGRCGETWGDIAMPQPRRGYREIWGDLGRYSDAPAAQEIKGDIGRSREI